MKRIFVYGLILLNISITDSLYSQELRVTDFRAVPLDVSAREKPVFDPNGDGCAIIKVRTGLPELEFSSDLEIKKVELHDGEYWIWTSPGTRKLKLSAPGFPEFEFDLPAYTEEFNVYIIFLAAILPQNIIYKVPSNVTFTTKPPGSAVYINDTLYGFTPVTLNLPFEDFNYKVVRDNFLSIYGNDTLGKIPHDYFFRLKQDPLGTRFYFSLMSGITFRAPGMLYGFSLGTLGKVGFSYNMSFYKPDNEASGKIRVSTGINPRILKNLFLPLNIGYARTLNTDSWLFNTGFILRTNNRILINFGAGVMFIQGADKSGSVSLLTPDLLWADLNFGIGYNF